MRESRKKTTKGMAMALLAGGLVSVSLMGCASLQNALSWFPFGFEPKDEGLVHVRPSRKTAESYYKTGLFYQERKDYALAAEYFRDAARVDSSFFAAYNSLGVCYDQMRMFKEAVTAYQAAIHLNPDRDEVLNNLGYSQLLQGDFDAAIKAFTAAISLSPVQNRRYYNNLGLAYTKKGLYGEAYRAFVVVGGEERARRNIVALAPSPIVAREFLSATPLGAETNYPSAGEKSSGPKTVMAEPPAVQLSEPEEESLTSGQPESLQPELSPFSLQRSGKQDAVAPFPLSSETEKSDRNSLVEQREKKVEVTAPTAPDRVASAPITSEPGAARTINGESQPELSGRSTPGPEAAAIAVGRKNSVAVATIDSPKGLPLSVSGQPFVVALAVSPANAAVAANLEYFLSQKRYKVKVKSHKSNYEAKTIIYFAKENLQDAYQLAKIIPGEQLMKQDDGLPSTRFRVVLGEDMNSYFAARLAPYFGKL